MCLSVAAVVGFIGNGLVVVVILRAKKMRSVMNRFILHLAVSDLVVSVLAIPLFLFINFSPQIASAGAIDALVTCKIARFFQYLSPEASMTLLITIGWNRHQAVVHPLKIMSYGTANKFILGAWIYALVVVAPSLYLTAMGETAPDPSTNLTKPFCATIPASTTPGLLYVMFIGVVGYIIPLVCLVVLYSKIYRTVWRRKSAELGDTRPVEAFIRSRKKVLKMFLTVIFFFLLTWLPLLLYVGVLEWNIKKTPSHVDHVRLVTYSFGLCNSICNPFIYALFNAKFRQGCKGLFRDSINVMRRRQSPRSNAVPTLSTGLPQAVLSRRGGFHGTKTNQKKPSEKRDTEKEPEKKPRVSLPVPVKQLVEKRIRSLTDLDVFKNKTNETVELITFRKLDPMGETPFTCTSSPEKSVSPTNSTSDICVRFYDDDVFLDDPGKSNETRPKAGNPAMTDRALKLKDGYSVLKNDPLSPAARSRSEGFNRKNHSAAKSRIQTRHLSRDF